MPSRSNAPPSGSVTSSKRRPLSGWRPVKHSPCRPSGSPPPSDSSSTSLTLGSSRHELSSRPSTCAVADAPAASSQAAATRLSCRPCPGSSRSDGSSFSLASRAVSHTTQAASGSRESLSSTSGWTPVRFRRRSGDARGAAGARAHPRQRSRRDGRPQTRFVPPRPIFHRYSPAAPGPL